jgi:hypothetical protein
MDTSVKKRKPSLYEAHFGSTAIPSLHILVKRLQLRSHQRPGNR